MACGLIEGGTGTVVGIPLLSERPRRTRVPWDKVDWRKPVKPIARELGVSPASVRKARARRRRPRKQPSAR